MKYVEGQSSVEISYEENGVIKKASQPITVVKKKPIKLKITKFPNMLNYLEVVTTTMPNGVDKTLDTQTVEIKKIVYVIVLGVFLQLYLVNCQL